MIKTKISSFTDVSSLTGSEYIPVLQGGQNKKATISQLVNLFSLLVIETEISSAQILDIHNTAALAIPDPGAGRWIRVVDVTYYHEFGTIAYTRLNSAQLQLYYSTDRTSSLNMVAAGGMLATSEDSISSSIESGGLSARVTSLLENRGVYIMSAASNQQFTTGDGTLKVTIVYRILTL